MAWASFPCQDLSLAGGGAGLKGDRSGTFYPFWNVMKLLQTESRAPNIVVLENVIGTLTSHNGKDFEAICNTYNDHGYKFGAVVVNADLFVPHSRPRLFFIGIRKSVVFPENLTSVGPLEPFHTGRLVKSVSAMPYYIRENWVWWNIPIPARRNSVLSDLIEDNPKSVTWHTAKETTKLISMMSGVNLAKIDAAKRAKRRMVGCLYKRTRIENGKKIQRAEVRFDDNAGCLRTPSGGSSRQTIVVVDGDNVKSRLISTRETARLMGLDDNYVIPNQI